MLKPGMMVKVKFPHMTINCKIISSTSSSVSVDYQGVRLQVDRSWIVSEDRPSAAAYQAVPDSKPAVQPEDIEIKQEPQPLRVPPLDFGLIAKRRSIESLRFGLVPNEAIQEMTLGFEELESWILSRFPKETGWFETVSQVCGSYGTGKSHTMSIIRYLAIKKGYASVHVEINGKDITLEAPDVLSAHLWRTLEADGLAPDTPLLNLYTMAIEKGHPPPSIAPHGNDKIRDNYRTISLLRSKGLLDQYSHAYESVLCSFNDIAVSELQYKINSEPAVSKIYDNPMVRRIIGIRVFERPNDFVESLNGTAVICKLAGYKGLIITIDEFEVQRYCLKPYRVKELIEVLSKYLMGKTGHQKAPLAIFFASVGQDGHLGDEIIEQLIDHCQGSNYFLREFEEADCIEIGRKIFNLYKEVYLCPGAFEYGEAQQTYSKVRMKDGHVRQFIKHYLANLDRKYGPPENPE